MGNDSAKSGTSNQKNRNPDEGKGTSNKELRKRTQNDPIANRLDALIGLFIEVNNPRSVEKFNEGVAARILKSSGLTPTEIARILGKKSATDVAPYLYPKKKG